MKLFMYILLFLAATLSQCGSVAYAQLMERPDSTYETPDVHPEPSDWTPIYHLDQDGNLLPVSQPSYDHVPPTYEVMSYPEAMNVVTDRWVPDVIITKEPCFSPRNEEGEFFYYSEIVCQVYPLDDVTNNPLFEGKVSSYYNQRDSLLSKCSILLHMVDIRESVIYRLEQGLSWGKIGPITVLLPNEKYVWIDALGYNLYNIEWSGFSEGKVTVYGWDMCMQYLANLLTDEL